MKILKNKNYKIETIYFINSSMIQSHFVLETLYTINYGENVESYTILWP